MEEVHSALKKNSGINKQLMNSGAEDSCKSEGRIQLKIENLKGFVQEELYSQRLSDPVHVGGVPWKISATLRVVKRIAPKQKCLGYFLECNDQSADPLWSCFATAQFKIVAQKEGKVDFMRETNCSYAGQDNLGFAQFMTFKDLFNPDKGWYDEQADSITLAVDLSGVGEYVMVAENELTLDKVPTSFSVQIANLGWQINFKNDKKKKNKSLVLSCKDVTKGRADKVLFELFGYHREDPKSELYSPILHEKAVHRHLFTNKYNSLTVKVPRGCQNILFKVRVWKERSQFPDFTKPTAVVGRFSADVKLRVGDQQFHVNKLLLSVFSPFFDHKFHSDCEAARQEELELDVSLHSSELFHQFLLVMCVNEVFPNSINVAALFKLADFYNADNVRQKCDQHIRKAWEMQIEKRMMLACDFRSKPQDLIVGNINLEQAKRISIMFMQKR